MLPPAILKGELRQGTLRILKPRPALVRPRLYAAYQVDKAGPGMSTVLETAREVIGRSGLLASARGRP